VKIRGAFPRRVTRLREVDALVAQVAVVATAARNARLPIRSGTRSTHSRVREVRVARTAGSASGGDEQRLAPPRREGQADLLGERALHDHAPIGPANAQLATAAGTSLRKWKVSPEGSTTT
jgi:hypothetical protein